MKTIKYISILVLSACMVALFSCTEDEIVKKGTPGDGHTLRIELTTDANREVSPLSKASANDPQEKVTDLNILIYENGTLVENESQYIDSGTALSDLSELSTKEDKASTPFTLTDIEPGDKVVYVVANAGQSLINSNDVATEDGLKNKKFTMNGVRPQFVMFAEGQSFNVANNPSITSSLKRIYAMVTVKMAFNKLNSNIKIIPQSVQLKHIPTSGLLGIDNKIQNESECLIDGEMIEKGSNANFLLEDHSSATPLFLYENRQPNGWYNGDERSKTPKDFGEAITMPDIIKTDRKCSYIEIQAKYIKNNNESGAGSGTITYRFFLGENAIDNFDIQRNYYYKVTLNLTGEGGKDEATWRVETVLKEEISIQDVYIGYRMGAQSFTQATGEFNGVSISPNNKEISVSINNSGGVTVTANETNTHDYNSRTFSYNYTVNGVTKTAKVIQVPRLVDPIAIYKKATNDNKTTIRVKAYNPNTKNYELLQSNGPWTAVIKSASTDKWFAIAPEGKMGTSEAVSEIGQKIEGSGPVVFDYKPRSKNTVSTDLASGGALIDETNDAARYGVILVKYHNSMCEHEIFLRQGYQPTTMAGSVWPMFNCTGGGNYTTYPTETGWFFKAGNNIGIHPYDPGYEKSGKVMCSDGNSRYFKDIEQTSKNWVQSENSDNAKQGPCPDGYKLASAPQLESLFTTTEAYTGFVYDDDYPVGGDENDLPYGYTMTPGVGHQIVSGTGNHCNPAKGAIVVPMNDTKGKNIFFTFGKGTISLEGVRKRDPNLIAEIGIGHRGINGANKSDKSGYLKFYEFLNSDYGHITEHTYGAFYWGGTRFSGDKFSRVCFFYDILTRSPYYADTRGGSHNTDANGKPQPDTGIDAVNHGSFVRCVRNK